MGATATLRYACIAPAASPARPHCLHIIPRPTNLPQMPRLV